MHHFVRRSTYVPFRWFLGGVRHCGENSCNVFLVLFMVIWILILAMLCKRAVLMLWHAFLFLGLRHVGFSSFSLLLGGFHSFFVRK
jgi:hypothetical protein